MQTIKIKFWKNTELFFITPNSDYMVKKEYAPGTTQYLKHESGVIFMDCVFGKLFVSDLINLVASGNISLSNLGD